MADAQPGERHLLVPAESKILRIDRETLAWLRKHVGDVRVAAAARHLGGNGKPYLSAVCCYQQIIATIAGRYLDNGRRRHSNGARLPT